MHKDLSIVRTPVDSHESRWGGLHDYVHSVGENPICMIIYLDCLYDENPLDEEQRAPNPLK